MDFLHLLRCRGNRLSILCSLLLVTRLWDSIRRDIEVLECKPPPKTIVLLGRKVALNEGGLQVGTLRHRLFSIEISTGGIIPQTSHPTIHLADHSLNPMNRLAKDHILWSHFNTIIPMYPPQLIRRPLQRSLERAKRAYLHYHLACGPKIEFTHRIWHSML